MGLRSLRTIAAVNATVVLPKRRSGLSQEVLVHACVAVALLLAADPAAAQVAASIGLDSDYRLRGYSLTNDHPAVTAQISYDDPSGFYLTGSSLGDLLSGGLRDLVNTFKQAGQGDAADSWVAHGPNKPIGRSELEQAIGPELLETLSRQTGLSREEIVSRLLSNLPEAVDKYTPEGRIPTGPDLSRA